MTTRLRLTALAAFAAAAFSMPGASAQTMKPGLWESSSKTQSSNPQIAQAMAEAQKRMAAMTPEQRKAMEDMMGKHGGPKMGMSADGTMTVKLCLTKKMIDDAAGAYLGQQSATCTHKKGPVTGNTMSFSYACTEPPMTGEGKVVFQGDTAYNSKMSMTMSTAGRKETMNVDASGKWLGADCGDIKPIDTKPAAPAQRK